VHSGVTIDRVRAATGWDLRIAEPLGVTEPPTPEELATLRTLQNAGEPVRDSAVSR
jgi:glutaconate CoA-transferase subunit B